VPADAEIVIEGHIDPSEAPVSTGPMLTRSGRYAPPRPAPVMHVVALTHRVKPVFPAMVPALPPNETCMIDRAMGRVLLPLVKPAIAEMVDYELPMHGAARHWAVISTDKRYAGQARRVAGAAWAQQLFMFAKVLVIVDREVDVHDTSAVLSAISANVYPPRDVFFEQGPPDPADVAAPPDELGQKMGIDATVKLSVEQAAPCSQLPAMSEEIRRLVEQRWAEYGIAAQPDRNPP